MDRPPRLIVFDVEGVLLPKKRYLLLEATRRLGPCGVFKLAAIGLLYELGVLSLEGAIRGVYGLFRGVGVDALFRTFRDIPLIPGVEDVLCRLREAGFRVALISSGLPSFLVGELAERLGADYAFGLDVDAVDGRLTGRVGGDVIRAEGKAVVLKRLLDGEGFTPDGCVVVADDRNNLPMLPLCGLRIGFNPDFLMNMKSDYVVKGSLKEVLSIIGIHKPHASSSYLSRNEAIREAIHIGSFSIPLLCHYGLISRSLVSAMILIVTVLYAYSELSRLRRTNVPVLSSITWRAAVGPELYDFAATPIYFALGIVLSLTILPAPIGYASVAVLTLGDGLATVSGRMIGRTHIPFNKPKTLEGLALGLLVAFLGASFFVNPVKALIGAVVGMAMEPFPSPLNDNVSVPLACGLVLAIIP